MFIKLGDLINNKYKQMNNWKKKLKTKLPKHDIELIELRIQQAIDEVVVELDDELQKANDRIVELEQEIKDITN